jgi:hypothetical protein
MEARFSHRTRVLDHILIGIPTIATAGDFFADMISDENMGITVQQADTDAVVDAIVKLRDNNKLRQKMISNIKKSQHLFVWEKTLTPLLNYLESNNDTARPFVPRTSGYQTARHDKITRTAKIAQKIKPLVPNKIKKLAKKALRKQ